MCYLEQALRPVPWLLSVPFPETLGVTHASVDLPVGLFFQDRLSGDATISPFSPLLVCHSFFKLRLNLDTTRTTAFLFV